MYLMENYIYDNCYFINQFIESELIEAANNLIYLKISNKQCEICNTTKTPLWRKSKDYNRLCNRCGIRERIKNKTI
jgi:hypothetical protein